MKGMRAVAVVCALGMLPSGSLLAQAPTPRSLEEVVSEMADTPEAHRALADYYRGKAQTARAAEESHRRMGMIGSGKMRRRVKMREHCARIADAQASLAKEYEELAQLHEKEAQGADAPQ